MVTAHSGGSVFGFCKHESLSPQEQGKEGSQKELPDLYSVSGDRLERTVKKCTVYVSSMKGLICRRGGLEVKVLQQALSWVGLPFVANGQLRIRNIRLEWRGLP